MKNKITAFLLSLSFLSVAQNSIFEWAVGSSGGANPYSSSIDNSGNMYTAGSFGGTTDFDPGAGTFNLISNGFTDIYIQKLDLNGGLLWAKSIGASNIDDARSLATDNSGNVYITGGFVGTVDFDPGPGVYNLNSVGGRDIFILKLDSNGSFVWANSIGGSSSGDSGYDIHIDGSGSTYTTGRFLGTVDFDPGVGVQNLTSSGSHNMFILKLDAAGNFIWAKIGGSNNQCQASSITTDAVGNIYTSGSFAGSVDFDPGAGVFNLTSNGSVDAFIQKLDSNGDLLWVKSIGGVDNEYCNEIKLGASGSIYAIGNFQGTVDFDPSGGVSNFTSNGNSDVFIQKFNDNGDYVWTKSMGGTDIDLGHSIAIDNAENIYITGRFQDSVDFDPGPDSFISNSAGNYDIFIQKLGVNGDFKWVSTLGSTGPDRGMSIALDNSNNIYTTGGFINTVDFDPNIGVFNLVSGGGDLFVLKLGQCQPATGIDVQTACDSYTWIDGNTYSSSNNTTTWTLTNSSGCDSVVTLELTINNSNTGVDIQTACDSYTWIDGNTYTTSNNSATWTLTNASGCDSVVTLDLTINNSNTGVDIQIACDSYTWIDGNNYTTSNNSATWTLTNASGCDSVVTLDLTINNSNTGVDVQTACDSYTWIDGNTYTNSNNTVTWTLTNEAGCDSVVTLDLTINNVSDNTTNVSGITILANNLNATYAWLDCDNNYAIINGETNASFTPITNGNYVVELTENGCTDTSACVAITTVGIIENTFIEEFTLYPNPTNGLFSIEFNSPQQNIALKISDASGKLIDNKNYHQVDLIEYELNQPKGIYLIEVSNGIDQRSLIRLLKQ